MNNAPEFTLHCDDCHHEVDIQGKMTAEHVGTPCPVCGSDMLTDDDYRVGRRVRFVMAILAFFGLARPADGQKRRDEVAMNFYSREGNAHIGPR